MAARQLIVPGAMPSRDGNGRALPAKLRFYAPGAAFSTPAIVYTDDTLITAHPFPVLSDAAGRWPPMWADEASTFDVGWSDQVFDRTIRTFTDVTPANDAVLASVDLANAAAEAAQLAQSLAEQAAALAQAAVQVATGAPFGGTSGSNIAIGAGAKVFVLREPGHLFFEGQLVVAAVKGNNDNQMIMRVDAYDDATRTMSGVVQLHAEPDGVGPYNDWVISLAASGGVVSLAGLTGIISGPAAKVALAITTPDISDFTAATAALVVSLSN